MCCRCSNILTLIQFNETARPTPLSHVADGTKSPSGHSLALARQGLDFRHDVLQQKHKIPKYCEPVVVNGALAQYGDELPAEVVARQPDVAGENCRVDRKSAAKKFVVGSWVMSCRAFSRRIEFRCLQYLFEKFAASEIVFELQATSRNGPLMEFLQQLLDGPVEAKIGR